MSSFEPKNGGKIVHSIFVELSGRKKRIGEFRFFQAAWMLSKDIVTGCGGNRMRISRHTAFVSDECHFARAKDKMAEKIWPQTLNPF
jgi:hypothetical protein